MIEPAVGHLPNGWSWTDIETLSDDIQYGYTAKASQDEVGPKLLRITDIQNNSVDWENVPYCEMDKDDIGKYLLRSGDIVFARTGATVGKSFLIQGSMPKAVFASYLIRVSLNQNVNSKFVAAYLHSGSYWNQIHEGKAGIGQPNVNASKLKQISLPIPPLTEQHRIVNKIEELFTQLDAGVELLQKTKVLLNQYRQSVLKAAFEGKLTEEWRGKNAKRSTKWESVTLGDISCLISGQHILQSDYNENGRGIPYLTGPADFGDIYPTITKWTEKPKAIAYKNGVLITVKGAGVGKVNILDIKQAAISRQLMEIRLNNSNVIFYYHYLRSRFHELQKLGLGSTVPGIDRESILRIPVPFLDIDEQNQVVQVIESHLSFIEAMSKSVMTSLKMSGTMRSSILNRAFQGKLVPQDPADEPASKLLERLKVQRSGETPRGRKPLQTKMF